MILFRIHVTLLSSNSNTTAAKKVFLQCHFKMFSKPLSLFDEPKTNKCVFQSEPEILQCFELNYKFLERHKKLLSLVTTRKQENPVNTA